ncbi:MAG: restriction endonuclease subunit S [Methanobrevibacter sp.]|uniref:restriction endonuclease subunit S n=1 Tax=Methanobrevibacter sp. TaxID=66852 RepID=UPI0025DB0718|nr:restriction endonuclease subunit S [Methanobrevibacter sp.]MBE6509428.1 restriction endonuclease subunit S [Methanobrevibacter sp.]
MSYKTYNNYKDSKIDWIKEIPSNWSISRVKNISLIKSGESPKFDDNGQYDVIGANGKIGKTNRFNISTNHIIIGRVGASGSVNISPEFAFISDNAFILTLNKQIDLKYSFYLFKALDMDRLINKNAQPLLTATQIKNLFIPHTTLNEQKQIANYLDKKTAKLDASIIKNEELIRLLEEKRVALINDVVTKGLNPDVAMKDSGVEWIGEIPEHWKTNKIKNMSYVKGRIGWHGLTSEEYADEGAYLVTGTDFAEGTIDWNHCNHINYERYKQDPNIHLKEGDLLITKDGTIGKLALVKNIPDKATLNSGIFLVRPLIDNYTNDYLYWILSSDIFIRFFDYIKTGATIAHLYQETFERFFFPYMSLKEQDQIVNYLNENVSKIDLTIKKVRDTIRLLEEYKTSLIHHVVTGKIDVRGEEI